MILNKILIVFLIVFILAILSVLGIWIYRRYLRRRSNFPRAPQKRLLAPISERDYFQLANGGVLTGIDDLIKALRTMDDSTFNEHVNEKKNDFVKWVRDVFKDPYLAEQFQRLLRKYMGRKQPLDKLIHLLKRDMAQILTKRVDRLNKKIERKKYKRKPKEKKLETLEHLPEKKEGFLTVSEREERTKQITQKQLKNLGFFSKGDIKSIDDLLKTLKSIDDEAFNTYLKENKVSFNMWLEDTLKDFELLKKIAKAYNKKDILKIIKQELVKSLYEEYSQLKKRVRQFRKKGDKPLIPELRLMNIPSKIKMVEVTFKEQDIKKVKESLKSISLELDYLENEKKMAEEAERGEKPEENKENIAEEGGQENKPEKEQENIAEEGEQKDG